MGQIATTAAGVLTGYSNAFGSIVTVAKGVLCLAQSLLNPGGLGGILGALNAAAGEVIAGLIGLVSSVVSDVIMQVTGVISAQLLAIQAFVQDIAQTVALIVYVLTHLDDLAKNTWKFLTDGQNCQFAAAELGRCIVAGLLGDVNKKMAMALSDGSLDYNTKMFELTSKLLGPEAAISKYTVKSQMFLNKASIQQTI